MLTGIINTLYLTWAGKDITTKLYSLNEQLGVGAMSSEGVRGGAQDVWRGVVQRSMSVDNVHTGTKGFVRSLAWRASHRRTSATYCDSVSKYTQWRTWLTYYHRVGVYTHRRTLPPSVPQCQVTRVPQVSFDRRHSGERELQTLTAIVVRKQLVCMCVCSYVSLLVL